MRLRALIGAVAALVMPGLVEASGLRSEGSQVAPVALPVEVLAEGSEPPPAQRVAEGRREAQDSAPQRAGGEGPGRPYLFAFAAHPEICARSDMPQTSVVRQVAVIAGCPSSHIDPDAQGD